jgi:pimeloyl-ACP methyl ester carboxylesterase
MSTRPTRLTYRTPDGLTLVADAWGDSSQHAVLLMHGGGQTRHAWGGTARALAAAGWYAVAADLRGHGDSDWAPDGDYAMERFARDIAAIARTFASPPVLVGASLSGLAGLLACGAPMDDGSPVGAPPFAALVLVDVTPRLDPAGARHIVDFMSARLDEGFASLEEAADTIAAYVPHRTRPKDLSGLAKNLRLHADGRYRWHWDPRFVSGKRPPDVYEEPERLFDCARALRIPTLLVRGRMSDLVTLEAAQEFLAMAPGAQFADVSGAGHMVAGDRNDVFTAAVADFLRRSL